MKFSVAIAVSVVVHLLIGLALWAYMEYAPEPDVLATLDLSSVELSFAEAEDDTAAVLPRDPVPELAPPKPELLPEPESEPLPEPLPEIPDAVDIPKPTQLPQLPTPPPTPPTPQTSQTPQTSPSSPASAPRQARVDAPPRPRRTIKPDYPKGARQRGEQGDVVVELRVNAEGFVDQVEVVTSSGFAELDEAALRAVRAAKFVPAKSGHSAVASSARLTLTFRLK